MKQNVVIVGLGLIGGSFAKAAARAGHAVSAVTRTPPADAETLIRRLLEKY